MAFYHVIDVALSVDAAWNGEPQQLVPCRTGEHEAADFDASDAGVAIEFDRERLSRELMGGTVGQHARGIDIDGVAAWRLDDGNALVSDVAAKVPGRNDAVVEIVGVENLFEPDRDGFEIAARETSVGRKSLGEDEQVGLLLKDAVIVAEEQAADVGEGILS